MNPKRIWPIAALSATFCAALAIWWMTTAENAVDEASDMSDAVGSRSVLSTPPPPPSGQATKREPRESGRAAVDAADFVLRLRDALQEDDLLRALEMIKEVSGLPPEFLHDLLQRVDAGEAGTDELDRLREILVRELALSEPEAASAYAFERRLKDGLLASLREWAARDFEAALAWSKEKGFEAVAFAHLMAGLAEQDLDEAMKRIVAAEPEASEAALRAVAATLDNASERFAFFGQVDARNDEDLKQRARAAVATSILDRQGFDAAAAFVEGLGAFPEVRDRLVREIALESFKEAGVDEAERRAQWLLEESRPAEQGTNIGSFVSRWAQRDSSSAEDWLGRVDPSASYRDSAIEGYVSTVAPRNPGEALDWSGRIEDERLRSKTMSRIYRQWQARDPGAADAHLRESGIDPESVSN